GWSSPLVLTRSCMGVAAVADIIGSGCSRGAGDTLEVAGDEAAAEACAEDDGEEVEDDDDGDEEEGGGPDQGPGGLGVGALEAEVVDVEAEVHEAALGVEEGES